MLGYLRRGTGKDPIHYGIQGWERGRGESELRLAERERQRNRLTERDLLSDVFEKARLRHTGEGGRRCVCVCGEGGGGISPKTALFFLGGS